MHRQRGTVMEVSPQFWGAIIAAFSTLAGVVVMFWKMFKGFFDATTERVKVLEEKREEDNEKVTQLTAKVAHLEGSKEGQEMAIEKTIKAVTDMIRDQYRVKSE